MRGAPSIGILSYGEGNGIVKQVQIGLLLFAAFGVVGQADAQLCCTTGSASASSFEIGVTPEKTLRISFGHEYNSLEGTFVGSKRTDSNVVGRGSVQAYTVQAHYGITKRLGITLSAPYVKTRRSFISGKTFGADGMGDMSFVLKYSLKPLNIASSREIAVGSGFKLPSGSIDLVNDGTDLNFNLQPGTGAWDFLLWGYYYKTHLPSGWSGSVSSLIRLPGTNADGLKFGREIFYSIVISRRLNTISQLSLRFKGRSSASVTIDGYENPNTGGTITFVAPSVLWNPVRVFSVEMGVDIPFLYSVSGTQQALEFRSFVDASFYFDL